MSLRVVSSVEVVGGDCSVSCNCVVSVGGDGSDRRVFIIVAFISYFVSKGVSFGMCTDVI